MYDYRPQTKFAKVVFLHLSVSHSVHPPGQVHPPPQEQCMCMLGDTGNKRAIRIPLECILVYFILLHVVWYAYSCNPKDRTCPFLRSD